MKRPYLVHFLAIMTEESLSIRASLALTDNPLLKRHVDQQAFNPVLPIQAYKLLAADRFTMLIIALDKEHNEIYRKTFDSDSFGNINFKIPITDERKNIEILQVYEINFIPGLELILGNYMPIKIFSPKKLIVCDFDKTLVHTKYSSTRELYDSLTRPINSFPTIVSSLEIVRNHLDKNYHPFILSASPHFYEAAMRDWLYQNKIYSAGIFLKDYRHILSLFEGDLVPKDIKTQGLYKLGHLLDILIMTGIPQDLVLMGDNFESDPIIYLALAKILKEDLEPWYIWKRLLAQDVFKPSKKQRTQVLNKIYQLTNIVNRHKELKSPLPNIKIYIRKKDSENSVTVPSEFQTQLEILELYEGIYESKSSVLA